jgi:Fe-Mn family superoxide dismutase
MLSRTVSRTLSPAARSFSSSPAILPDLGFEYGDLEPHISAQIMEIHHSKHHNTYVDSLDQS